MAEDRRTFKKATIEWRGNPPQPYPVNVDIVVTKENFSELNMAVLALPYAGKRDPETGEFTSQFEEEMDGLPCLEVMARRKAQRAGEGDIEFIKYVEDRILGKPTQHNQNLSVTMTLQDFAKQLQDLDESSPLREPPEKMPVAIEVSDTYEIIEVPDTLDVRNVSDEELLLDPLAGF